MRIFSLIRLLLAAVSLVTACNLHAESAPVYRWTTIAGRSSIGAEDGVALSARFNSPHGLARDSAGNLYVADTDNHTIRKISIDGVVTTIAGSAGKSGYKDGAGASAQFNAPKGIAIDPSGNLYVSDSGNFVIRKISATGEVTTLAGQAGKKGNADGSSSTALFEKLDQITVDATNGVYVTDNGIRHISGGVVQTLLKSVPLTTGTGLNVEAYPTGSLTCSSSGDLYFAANAIPVSSSSSYIFNHRLLKRSANGTISVVASTDYSDTSAIYFYGYNTPRIVAMTTDRANRLYIAFYYFSTYPIYYLATVTADARIIPRANVAASSGATSVPLGIVTDDLGNFIYTRDADSAILKSTTGIGIQVLAGTETAARSVEGTGNAARFAGASYLAVDRNGNALVADVNLRWILDDGYLGGVDLNRVTPTGTSTRIFSKNPTISPRQTPSGLGIDSAGNIYLSTTDYYTRYTIIAPDGNTTNFEPGNFSYVYRLAIDSSNRLVVSDFTNRIHRRSADGQWSVLAGGNTTPEIKDGVGSEARFAYPGAVTANTTGDIFVLDGPTPSSENKIERTALRRVQDNGTVTTLQQNLARTSGGIIDYPVDLALTSRGDFVLVYDRTIRLLTTAGNNLLIGGADDAATSRDGSGENARFESPSRVAVDAQNNLYVLDNYGQTLRRGELLGYGPDITNQPRSLSVNAGANAQFTVTASAATSYQWMKNGVAISGATSSSLSLANVTSANAGDYTVVVSNNLGSVTSTAATLTLSTSSGGSGSAGSSGGGGSPSLWFLAALLALGTWRTRRGIFTHLVTLR